MSHFLVTGATGFIGKRVVRMLLLRGHTVSVLLRPYSKSIFPENVVCYFYDFDDPTVSNFICPHHVDCVIHLAWGNLLRYNEPIHTELYSKTHYSFLLSLLHQGVSHFTVAGTSFEYGLQEGCLDETLVCTPVTEYGKAKFSLLQNFSEDCRIHNALLQWGRIFYLYAEDQRPQSLFGQLHTAYMRGDTVFNMSQGEQKRDYLHADAVANAFVRIASQQDVAGIINIGSGQGKKIIDMVKEYLYIRNSSMQLNRGYYSYPQYEPFSFWANVKKLENIL